MKKLMIAALAVVAVAAVSQAASINWKMASGQYVYDESTTKLKAGTAYLFDSAKVSQEALFALVFVIRFLL